jgi:hypothetical protein
MDLAENMQQHAATTKCTFSMVQTEAGRGGISSYFFAGRRNHTGGVEYLTWPFEGICPPGAIMVTGRLPPSTSPSQ